MQNPLFAVSRALSLPLFGQITVDFEISEGGTPLDTLTLEIDHVNAPMAAANFIGLASGVLPWIDSTTGVVQYNKPYFNGIKIHRTDLGFVSQFGSQKGDGSDGPGYAFPDEPDLGNLLHTAAYDLSMANSGPNTNGSQVFITADKTDFLDSKHIVFGKVALGTSRTVADHINSVPVVDADGPNDIAGDGDDDNRPVTDLIITSATVHYNDVTFDPRAQGLPQVSAPPLTSLPNPDSTELFFSQPPRSSSSLNYSGDLTNWFSVGTRYLDGEDPSENSLPLLGGAGNPTQFFAPSLITYDTTALFPSELNNHTLALDINVDPNNFMYFFFDGTGQGGTWAYRGFFGPFTASLFLPDGYGCRLLISAPSIGAAGSLASYFDFRRMGFDASSPGFLSGRLTGRGSSDPDFSPAGTISGTFNLSR